MFLYNISEDSEEQEESQESSESIGSKIDNIEDALERRLRLQSGSCYVMRCFGDILKILINGM